MYDLTIFENGASELNFEHIFLHRHRVLTTLNFSTISLSTISRECKRKRKKEEKRIIFENEQEWKEWERRFLDYFWRIRTPEQTDTTYEEHMIDAHMIDE